MARKSRPSSDQGQKKVRKPRVRRPKQTDPGSPLIEEQNFLHDLQLQKVELEIQNEELGNEKRQAELLLHKYTLRFDHAPACFFLIDENGLICDLNIQAAALLGKEKDLLINQDFQAFMTPGSKTVFVRFLENVLSGKCDQHCEVTFSKNELRQFPFLLTASFLAMEKICCLTVINQSGQKIIERALRETGDFYRLAFLKTPAKVLLIDPATGNIKDANSVAAKFYGFPAEQLVKMNFSNLNIRSQKEIRTILQKVAYGEEDSFVFKQRIHEGMIRDVNVHFDLMKIDGRSYLYSVVEDITDAQLISELNREQQFWKAAASKNSGAGAFSLDFVNDSWSSSEIGDEILGIGDDTDWTIHGFISLVHPDQRVSFQYYLFSEVIARKQPFDKEFRVIRPCDGHERWVKGNGSLEFDTSGSIVRMNGILRDITNLKRSQELLAEAEKMYLLLMNDSPDGIVLFDHEGKASEISAIIPALFGTKNKTELTGQHFMRFIPRDERRKITGLISRTFEENSPVTTECRLRKLDNSTFIGEISLTRIRKEKNIHTSFIAVIRDVTLRKTKEQLLIQHDRMRHLGEMATGMAHEINQPLNNISLTLDNVFHELNLRDSLHDTYLQHKSGKIFDNIIKIKNLIEHIREFARDDHSYAMQTLDINEVIRNALSTLLVQFDEKRIDLMLDLDDKLNLFMGDSFKVEQVLVNLLLNARDALEENEIRNGTSISKVIRIRSSQQNGTICIEIRDNGIGIKRSHLDQIMHPFFTTKDTGKGVGLGLSICHGIISELKGRLEVESKYLSGATFSVYLPLPENNC